MSKRIGARATIWLVSAVTIFVAAWAIERTDRSEARPADWKVHYAADGGFPRRCELLGHDPLTIAKPPERIVVADAAIADMLSKLVDANRIAAVCDQAFSWSQLAVDAGDWVKRPRFKSFVAEAVLVHEPDLVVCCTFNTPETTGILRRAGLPLLCLHEPRNLDDVRKMIRLLAAVTGSEGRADAVLADIDARVLALARQPGQTPKTALFYSNHGAGGFAAAGDTLCDTAMQLAGLRNVARGSGHVRLAMEELLTLDPEVLVIGIAAGAATSGTEHFLQSQAALSELRALRDRHIVRLHPALYMSGSQSIVAAAEEIARQVKRSGNR
ncbi:MAG: hypothetical protein CMJ85_06970 [Planctomycetes bacterium]|nr:hypothetical protein [Planctomycetota bacterium]